MMKIRRPNITRTMANKIITNEKGVCCCCFIVVMLVLIDDIVIVEGAMVVGSKIKIWP